jgi:hypothetical protein
MTSILEFHTHESRRASLLPAAPFVAHASRTKDQAAGRCAVRVGQMVDSAAKDMRDRLFAPLEAHVVTRAPVASSGVAK